MTSTRHFDIVLLGATGYTGRLCAEHIVRHFATNLRWGIAGRSADRLNALAEKLQAMDKDRKPPEILPVQLKTEEFNRVVKRTRVLINCVGPYHLHSSPVVEACANNGTHYLDATGEMLWVKEMIEKYHEKAKSTGAIMISADGLECAPADLLAWSLVSCIKNRFAVHTKQIVSSIYDMKTAGASGGTLSTVIDVVGSAPLSELNEVNSNPHFLSAERPKTTYAPPLLLRLLGIHTVPELGTLTTSPTGHCDVCIVQRSRSLMPDLYGQGFQFLAVLAVRNAIMALAVHFSLMFGFLALTFAPIRSLAKKLIYEPGQGPSEESTIGNRIEYRALATAEHEGPERKPIKVLGSFKYPGDAYKLTGVLLAESALVLLKSRRVGKEIQGGYMTPAILGQEYIDRLETVGVSIGMKVLEG
ncbi:hypothetical protein FQN51_003859 [Onygenales sp. PD_10]|nr:hypothetical protein FQN51_003859 [Onygenales sp. PD_10]